MHGFFHRLYLVSSISLSFFCFHVNALATLYTSANGWSKNYLQKNHQNVIVCHTLSLNFILHCWSILVSNSTPSLLRKTNNLCFCFFYLFSVVLTPTVSKLQIAVMWSHYVALYTCMSTFLPVGDCPLASLPFCMLVLVCQTLHS